MRVPVFRICKFNHKKEGGDESNEAPEFTAPLLLLFFERPTGSLDKKSILLHNALSFLRGTSLLGSRFALFKRRMMGQLFFAK